MIYVPQYEPATVIVQQSTPYYYPYYPYGYPCYYCYYPPGYAFAAGFFWGAATAWAFNWWGGSIHNDIDIDIDLETGEVVRHTPRVPHAVWINRPTHTERGSVRPTGALVGAIVVVALVAHGLLIARTQPLVPPAAAGTKVEPAGNGPTGYFPDTFERIRGEIEPLPPTF